MIKQYFLRLPQMSRGFHLITSYIDSLIGTLPHEGMLNIFLQHTSAGLALNENVDPTVRSDFETVMNKIVPESRTDYKHDMEGSDDLPAHVKSSLVGQSLTIPISKGRMALGMWQGIYLCEFRNYGGPRNLIVTVYS